MMMRVQTNHYTQTGNTALVTLQLTGIEAVHNVA